MASRPLTTAAPGPTLGAARVPAWAKAVANGHAQWPGGASSQDTSKPQGERIERIHEQPVDRRLVSARLDVVLPDLPLSGAIR